MDLATTLDLATPVDDLANPLALATRLLLTPHQAFVFPLDERAVIPQPAPPWGMGGRVVLTE